MVYDISVLNTELSRALCSVTRNSLNCHSTQVAQNTCRKRGGAKEVGFGMIQKHITMIGCAQRNAPCMRD